MTSQEAAVPKSSYGAVDENPKQVVERDLSYDIDNTYYVQSRPLSAKEKWRKFMLLAIPIVAAFLIMTGFAYVLFHALPSSSHRTSSGTENSPSSVITTPRNYYSDGGDKKKPAGFSVPAAVREPTKSSSTSSKKSSACKDNSKCQQLGLTGECCPTMQGVTLGCCS